MLTSEPGSLDALSPVELASEMALAVAAVADLETRYERDRRGILRWLGQDAAKQRLLARLEASRVRDRQALVLWLAEARQRHDSCIQA